MFKTIPLLLLWVFAVQTTYAQGLVINEISQGISGVNNGGEYVELLVYRDPFASFNCDCMKPDGTITAGLDLRGWILDDNNGYFASGSGTGIGSGAIRFADIPQWACVEYGTIILIYNNDYDFTGRNLPPDDETDSDGDCIYVFSGSSSLLEGEDSDYTAGGADWAETPSWTYGSGFSSNLLSNAGDSFMTIPPNNPDGTPNMAYTPYHSISWGNNYDGANTDGDPFTVALTPDATSSGEVYYIGGLPSSFTFAISPDNETPGIANDGQNIAVIDAILPPKMTATGEIVCAADELGQIDITITGGTSPYDWQWQDQAGNSMSNGASIPATSFPLSNLAVGNYNISITDDSGCEATAAASIEYFPIGASVTSTPAANCGEENGEATVIPASPNPYSYQWNNPATSTGIPANSTGNTIDGLPAGGYTVVATDVNGCQDNFHAAVTTTIPDNECINISAIITRINFPALNDGVTSSSEWVLDFGGNAWVFVLVCKCTKQIISLTINSITVHMMKATVILHMIQAMMARMICYLMAIYNLI